MSPKYEKVKRYYDNGLWDKNRARNAVKKHWITHDEYFEIVGEEY